MAQVLQVHEGESRRARVQTLPVAGAFVILAVLTLVLLPRPNDVPVQSLNVARAALAAQHRLGFPPAVPRGLGDGWTARDATVQRGTDGLPTWHLTYLTPSGEVAGVQQTAHATSGWEATQVTDGRVQGSRLIGGTQWVIRSRTDRGVTSLVRRPAAGSDLTTVVTGSGGDTEVEQLAVAVS